MKGMIARKPFREFRWFPASLALLAFAYPLPLAHSSPVVLPVKSHVCLAQMHHVVQRLLFYRPPQGAPDVVRELQAFRFDILKGDRAKSAIPKGRASTV